MTDDAPICEQWCPLCGSEFCPGVEKCPMKESEIVDCPEKAEPEEEAR